MLLKYKEDRINVFRGLVAPFIFFYPYLFGFLEIGPILTSLALWVLLNDINHLLHLHVHLPFTRSRVVNLVLDISMGFVTGMTASNWRIQHKYGHHSAKKGEYCKAKNWEMERYSIRGALWYSFRTIFPIFYKPVVEAFKKGMIDDQRAPINYRHAFFEQFALIVVVTLLLIWQPKITLCYLLPWYVFVFFITRYTDYLNHFGCSEDKFRNANNSLNRVYNLLGNNFGYHTAHHLYPIAHWTMLPDIHEKIRDKIPDEQKKSYSWSGFLLPHHCMLSLGKAM